VAITYSGTIGCNADKTSSASIALTSSRAVSVGDLVVVRLGVGVDADLSASTCVDSTGSNTYTRVSYTHGSGASRNRAAIYVSKIAAALTTSTTITVSWTGVNSQRALVADSWAGAEATEEATGSWASTDSIVSTLASGNSATPTNANYLVVGQFNFNGAVSTGMSTQDSDTSGGSWSNFGAYTGTGATTGGAGTTGGAAGTNQTILGGYKIATSAAVQNYACTAAGSGRASSGVHLFQETSGSPPAGPVAAPVFTFQAVKRSSFY
jgi:hypothetical protein